VNVERITIQLTRRGLVLLALFLTSLWIRQAFPVLGLGSGEFDDMLFVRMAARLSSAHWLGPYNNLTLAKGIGYPALIAVNHLFGLPLKLTEQAFYLGVSLLFALVFSRILKSRWTAVAVFAVLAFDPVMWAPEVGGRIVRENLYASLSLGLLAAALWFYVAPLNEAATARPMPAPNRFLLLLIGFAGGWFWLTREEGLWLVPAIAVPIAAWAIHWLRRRVQSRRAARVLLRYIIIPLFGFCLVVGVVNSINLAVYGVFRNNDFRSSDFGSAYGALSRISQDHWQRYVVFPKDARERAYRVSAAARELEPFFEGEGGAFWTRVSCEQTNRSHCKEILSGWFMWALRDAVARTGHYSSASESQRFYQTLTAEIDHACAGGEIPCGPPHHTLVPPWHPEYAGWTLDSARAIVATLVSLGQMQIHSMVSLGTEEELGLMRRMIDSPVSTSDVLPHAIRARIAGYLTTMQRLNLTYLLPIGLVIWLGVCTFHRGRCESGPSIVLLSLLTAVVSRVALLAFLDATSIPSNNLLYLSPAIPMALAAAPCALAIIFKDISRGWSARAGSREA
jgi:hypothetical protein